jgi:hypothetical protein
MLPTELNFTCPHCRDSFDAPLVNGVGEFQCFGCKRHYRLTVAADKEPGDFDKREIVEKVGNERYTQVESLPQELKLTVTLKELNDESEYWVKP